MYQAHWGLSRSPFSSRLDTRRLFLSPTHEEALARLHFVVEQGRQVGLMLGPAGSGKSLVLERFAEEVRRQGTVAVTLNVLGLQPVEMLSLLADGLGAGAAEKADLPRLWRRLRDRLLEHRYQQLHTAVILDDAAEASADVLDQVVRLLQCDPHPDNRLTVILAAEPGRVRRLGHRLLELVDLRIDLHPFLAEETESYVQNALRRAGCRRSVFDSAALGRLHELSQGIPRRVSQLADLALMAAAGQELDRIDAEVVDSVYRELASVEV